MVPKGYWGRVMGVYGGAEDVGILVGASVSTFVWGTWGIIYSLSMMGSISAFVGVTVYVSFRMGILRQRSVESITD